MKKLIFTFLLVFLVSCSEKEIKYYPTLLDNKEKIAFKNYKAFVEEVISLSYDGKSPYMELTNENVTRKIFFSVRGNGLIKERNIIENFDGNRLSRSIYESIAWAGLGKIENNQSTIAWQNLTLNKRKTITNVLNKYFLNGISNCN